MNRHTQKDQLGMALFAIVPAVVLLAMWIGNMAGMII